jgi:hypothetical protein
VYQLQEFENENIINFSPRVVACMPNVQHRGEITSPDKASGEFTLLHNIPGNPMLHFF